MRLSCDCSIFMSPAALLPPPRATRPALVAHRTFAQLSLTRRSALAVLLCYCALVVSLLWPLAPLVPARRAVVQSLEGVELLEILRLGVLVRPQLRLRLPAGCAMLRRWQRVLRAEDSTFPQWISSCVHAATRHAAPCATFCRPSAAHISCRMRAAELIPVSQQSGICVRRPAENATACSVLGDARALDARELVRLVVLTERAAAPERR